MDEFKLVALMVAGSGTPPAKPDKTEQRIKSLFFMLGGLVFVAVAIGMGISTERFVRSSVVVPGRVTALPHGSNHPIVTFVTKTGESIDFPQGGRFSGAALGEQVNVRYDPAAPRVGPTVDEFGALWNLELVFFGLGAMATIIGIVGWLRPHAAIFR